MLVQYTPLSSLSADELQRLRTQVRGIRLEASIPYFVFEGKTLSISELSSQKRVWESENRGPGQTLLG